MIILYSRMEELVTLLYGCFMILGERVKEFAKRTSCSKRVADWTLWGQLYLSEMRREHLGWNTTQHQEWGLFLLENLLHNAATMRWKEHERLSQSHSQAKWPEMAKVMAPEHPSVGTLLGSNNAAILKVAEQVDQGGVCAPPLVTRGVPSRITHWTGQAHGLNWPPEWTRTS